MLKKIVSIIIFILLVTELILFYRIIKQDSKLLSSQLAINNKIFSDEVMSGLPYYEQQEKTLISVYNYQWQLENRDCALLETYANRLREINPRSSQAYLILGRCSNLQGETLEGVEFLHKAISVDPLNTLYRVILASQYLDLNDVANANVQLRIVERIDPATQDLDLLKSIYAKQLSIK